MSINDFVEKVKSKISPFYYLILLITIAGIFFALGRLSAIEERHQPIRILAPSSGQAASVVTAVSVSAPQKTSADTQNPGNIGTDTALHDGSIAQPATTGGEVVGSKTSKKYYFPWCSTVKRIKPEDQVRFSSSDLAKAAGYSPGGNCKGLQ